MIRVRPIESIDLPELGPYRSMRWQVEHRRAGVFIAEGEKVVRRLLASSLEIVSILLPDKWLESYEPLVTRRQELIDVFVAPKPQLEKLTGFSLYQGVLAMAKVPTLPALADILASAPAPQLFLAAEEISNAENVGVLVRNSTALGAQALIQGETCASPYLRRAVRSSMGTLFKLPIVESPSLVQALAQMRARGIRVIAAHPGEQNQALSEVDFRGDCCIVVGSEGGGLSAAVLEECDQCAAIPMQKGVDSLNVASASAIFLHEAARQRRGPSGSQQSVVDA